MRREKGGWAQEQGQEAGAEWWEKSWEWRLGSTVEGPNIRTRSLPLSCFLGEASEGFLSWEVTHEGLFRGM